MRWNAARFEWEGEDEDGRPIAVDGEAFMQAVAEYLLALYGTAENGYSEAQRDKANFALHEPGAWSLDMPGVRPLYAE